MLSNIYLDSFGVHLPLLRDGVSGASPPPAKRTKENVVTSIWMEQPWAPYHLRCVTGDLVEIVCPGWLNGGAGPDFKDALFKLGDGDVVRGDVELHVWSSDWERHGHHKDPAYNNTVLHVVMYCDSAHNAHKLCSGETLVEIELDPICKNAVERIRSEMAIDPTKANLDKVTGRCGDQLGSLGADKIFRLIEAAGLARLELKSERYAKAITRGKGELELYQGLFEAFGYHVYKARFAKLAKAAPAKALKQALYRVESKHQPITIQALLMGVAGFIPETLLGVEKHDRITQKYMARLIEVWKKAKEPSGLERVFDEKDWKAVATRPANLPSGRLAGLSHFLALHIDGDLGVLFSRSLEGFPIDGAIKDKRNHIARIANLFPSPVDDYWTWRYTLGGKRLAFPRKLVGIARVELLLINVILPFMLARARTRNNESDADMARKLFCAMPKQANNSIVKFMQNRLAEAPDDKAFVETSVRQQGLQQIYSDFCVSNVQGCVDCRFANYLEKLKER